MSYSENLKFAAGAERARDLAWARKCEEEDRYENECDYRYKELYKELKAKKAELTEDFAEIEYEALGEYLRDYDVTPNTELQEVIEAFIAEIDN